ncbi:MAG: peptidoglycan D,D-transpeptidase FtsI family protein [Candidatus Nanopelagicales bacterium]
MSTRLAERPDIRGGDDRQSRDGDGPGDFATGDVRRRGTALLLAIAIIASIFATRLVDLQAVRGEALADAALSQRLRTLEVPAYRGSILDRTGQPLAVTVEARNITADQTLIDDPAAVAVELAPILEVPQDVLADRLSGDKRFMYVAKGVSPGTWDQISSLRLPGIFSEETSQRIYPADNLASHIVGFVQADGSGGGGIESAFNELLTGTPGTQTYESGPGGRVIPTSNQSSVAPIPGGDVQLTIDRDIQFVAQEAIQGVVQRSGASSATAVVMDVQTGEILALATAPDFDPNAVTQSLPEERRNRAVSDIFEPGSTGKVITAAAAINEGAVSPLTPIKVPGQLKRAGKSFNDYWKHGTLNLTVTGVFARSSNIGTILAAERMPQAKDKLANYMERFGIGEKTELGLPGESGGLILDQDKWSGTTFPTMSFGQGYSVNTVQMTSVFATIANGGVKVQPSIVESIVRPDGTIEQTPDGERERVVREDTARQVMAMMEAVVGEGGTAPQARIPGYRIAGKTGTAQFVDPDCRCYAGDVTSSFIGVAPADAPRLAVGVFVHQPKRGRGGGELAAPVFKEITTYALQALQIAPSGKRAPRLTLTTG